MRGGDELPAVVRGIEAAVRHAVEDRWVAVPRVADHGLCPVAADLGELGILLDLDPPALIVGEVELEPVELVDREQVDEVLELLDGEEVAPGIEARPS